MEYPIDVTLGQKPWDEHSSEFGASVVKNNYGLGALQATSWYELGTFAYGRTIRQREAMATDEYTIDEPSAATRVPSRTIRFYQSKGALNKPEIRSGRYLLEAHVARLKLIAKLQDQDHESRQSVSSSRVWTGMSSTSATVWLKAQLQTRGR